MTPRLALFVVVIGVLGLFWLDRSRRARLSPALWLPVTWLLIGGSRMISGWVQGPSQVSAEQVVDGSPLDRNLLTVLTILGVMVLIGRRRQIPAILKANIPLLLFLAYCVVSMTWSEYPFVALKRFIKTCGDLVMVVIVLTEVDRVAAMKRLLGRLGFIWMPFSLLLIRYYSELGRGFDQLTGESTVFGVTTGKNLLGMICMISGLGVVWRVCLAFRGADDEARRPAALLAQFVVLGMALWLFYLANSMTSFLCFLMSSSFVLATAIGVLDRKRWIVHVAVVSALIVAVSILLLGAGGGFLKAVGRDPTLTGRTEIWGVVKEFAGNPWIGTGFESFWLGDRLEGMWARYWWHPNEAHCGYLDMFLNLGWVGEVFFAGVVVNGYRNVIREYRRNPAAGAFGLGFFVAVLAYNVTETAVRYFHPLWVLMLLSTMVPQVASAHSEAEPVAEPRRDVYDRVRRPGAFRPVPLPQPAAAGHRGR